VNNSKNLKILTYLTKEVDDSIWASYVKNFNLVFHRKFDLTHFKNKYTTNSDNSYHSFLIDNNQNVIAGVSVIPMDYIINNEPVKIGLVVDLFVLSEFRKDPLIILKLYIDLKKNIIKDKLKIIVAVPNKNSVNYFVNLLKFKHSGNLNYWVMPINIGNVKFNGNNIANIFSNLFSLFSVKLNMLISFFISSKKKTFKIQLNVNDVFLKNRFFGPYKSFKQDGLVVYYRIVEEEGVRTAYLIYFKLNSIMGYKALLKAVKLIKNNEDIDLIIYVGKLNFFQLLLYKVPKIFEPKDLPFIYDVLDFEGNELKLIENFKNWDFGLINYDVR
jgi:hypothetical protein